MDDYLTYRPTPDLSEEDGRALLEELGLLDAKIDFNEDGRARRQSRAQEADIAVLSAALIRAQMRFGSRQACTDWINQNHAGRLLRWDPMTDSDHERVEWWRFMAKVRLEDNERRFVATTSRKTWTSLTAAVRVLVTRFGIEAVRAALESEQRHVQRQSESSR